MVKNQPIRVKLMVVTMSVLFICCLGLTVFTTLSAKRMSHQIASTAIPAININPSEEITGDTFPSIPMTQASIMPDQEEVKAKQEQILKQYYLSSFGYMVGIIIVGGLLAYYLSGRAMTSLVDLNSKIKNSSVDTLADELEVPPTHDEIAELTVSFNKMTRKLKESFDFQQQFSANVAHELRTPLTVLNTKLEVIKRKNPELDQESTRFIDELSLQVGRLIEMVEKLLQLTHEYQLEEQSTILAEDLINSILPDFSESIQEKEISVTVELGEQELMGDLELLYRAFYNVIENALKYNVQGGSLTITGSETQGFSKFVIADTGVGIPKEYQDEVFQSLFRVDDARDRKVGGVGLGLAIVKKIIEAHQGTITVEDNQEAGRGTTFSLTLPNKKEAS